MKWPDIGKVSRADSARLLNRTTARLGYVWDESGRYVINPECDSKGNLKPVEKP